MACCMRWIQTMESTIIRPMSGRNSNMNSSRRLGILRQIIIGQQLVLRQMTLRYHPLPSKNLRQMTLRYHPLASKKVYTNSIGEACGFNVDSRYLDRCFLHAGASKRVDMHLTDTYFFGSWIAIPSHVICPCAFDHGCWIAIPNGRFGNHSSFWIVIRIKSMNIIILGVG